MSLIGQSIPRVEDRPLLTGDTSYAADLSAPNQLHMRVVRSALAFGRLRGIDVEEAKRLPGVAAVWTAADVSDIPPIDFRMTKVDGLEPYRQLILAADRVRYAGEPVAAVFADDAYLAEDAAQLVFADIEPEAPYLDPTAPPASFDGEHSTEAAVIEKGYGDLSHAFHSAAHVVELELRVGRHTGVPMETRGALARYDGERDLIELFGAAKVPHYNRDAIAAMLGLGQEQVVVHEGHVGGGFGVRGELYPEDVIVCLAARRLGRPIRWIEDRREHLVAANHSRDQVHRVRAAVADDGYILGLEVEFWLDQGAYVRTHAATVPDLTAALLPGPYRIPAYRVTGHIRLTNKTPCGTYRGPGRYEGTFVRERLIDAVARRTGIEPVEVRRRNLIGPDEMPFSRGVKALGTDVSYDSGDYPSLHDQVLEHLGCPELRHQLEQRRRDGELVGLGFGFFVEKSGLGPFDGVRVGVDTDGLVEVVTGVASIGQGVETVLAQISAETLGVPVERVRVRHGQTDAIAHGMGAFASRATVMAGSATQIASANLREKALEAAAELLEATPADLVVEEGRIFVRGSPGGPSVTLGEVAASLEPAPALAAGRQPGLTAEGWFTTEHMTYPYGLHAAVVKVDPGSGGVDIERYVIGYDVGRAINPVLVEGQLVGGAAQGIGGALLEEFVYDEDGQPLATSFMDYLMPTVAEMPPVEVLLLEEAPSPLNPLGVKGAGEGGCTGAGATVASAVEQAIGRPGAITELPITPARLRALLSEELPA